MINVLNQPSTSIEDHKKEHHTKHIANAHNAICKPAQYIGVVLFQAIRVSLSPITTIQALAGASTILGHENTLMLAYL